MLYKKEQSELEKQVEQAYENWPQVYYEIEDKEKRWKLLEQAIADGIDEADNLVRKRLWELRYKPENKKDTATDRFMKSWLMLFTIAREGSSFFNRKSNEKILRDAITQLGIFEYASLENRQQALYIKEWKLFTESYFRLCAESREYQAYILGFGKLKDDALIGKMANEIHQIFTKVPALASVNRALLEPFEQAVKEVFIETFVGAEEALKKLH